MRNKKKFRKRLVRHLGRVSLALISASLMSTPVSAAEPAEAITQVMGSEGGQQAAKEALNTALKAAKSKPAMSLATGIVCISCVPVAGAVASPAMCIACGILITKTFG